MQKFSLLKRRPVRHRAEYDRLYLTRDQQLSCFDPIANRGASEGQHHTRVSAQLAD